MTEDDLDNLFAAARAEAVPPPADLTARVISDAEVEILAADLLTAARPRDRRKMPGVVAHIARLFGGTGALAGMLTATVAGFWLGFAQPAAMGSMSAALTGASAEIDMMPGIDALLDEAP